MHETTLTTDHQNDGLIRFGGLSVILALLLHVILNGAVKQFPPQNPSLAELQAYLSAEASTWAIVHGLKYLALVGLVFFAAGLFARTSSTRGRAIAGWGVVGLLGTAIHVTNAVIANGIEILAFFDFSRLSEDPTLFWLLFHLVRVLFTAEIVAWGLVIFGFSMAGFQSAALPKWIAALGFFSSAACLMSGVFVVSVLTDGWATILMEVAGLTGLAWFACVGVYMMMRGDS
jgi:hypothetical protein